MLYIVTPLSRPENLEKIAASIKEIYKIDPLYRWYVVLDKKLTFEEIKQVKIIKKYNKNFSIIYSPYSNSFVGHSHRNEFLNKIFSQKGLLYQHWSHSKLADWVYFLDDDTLLHPSFLDEIISNLDYTKSAIIFDQENKDGTIRLRADIDKVKVCHIDMGQYVVNLTKLPEDLRFKEDDYCADGIFIEELFNKVGPEQFLVINKTLSTYNKLR